MNTESTADRMYRHFNRAADRYLARFGPIIARKEALSLAYHILAPAMGRKVRAA